MSFAVVVSVGASVSAVGVIAAFVVFVAAEKAFAPVRHPVEEVEEYCRLESHPSHLLPVTGIIGCLSYIFLYCFCCWAIGIGTVVRCCVGVAGVLPVHSSDIFLAEPQDQHWS